ncbi:hypothetical protein [Ferrovibrio xuzhouensis]|uniref:Uncharacterized protein n=1 Tax=Ferrovibrio xuzhouensis TaxID=1576914 RepID=A0ABV7VF97_9PROT
MATMVAKAMMHIRGMRLASLILAGLLVAIQPAAAQQDPGLEIQRRAQQDFERQQQQRDLDYQGFLQRQQSESLRQDQNRQQQMQQDLRRSEDGLRLPDNADAARLRALQQRRADEAQQRQLDNQRRQIDARNRQLQNDQRRLETQQRLDRLTKP